MRTLNPWNSSHHRLSAIAGPALVAVLTGILTGPVAGQAVLQTDKEVQDGEVNDLAVQKNATANAADKRAWVAQGRVRAAIRLSTRRRMFDEDATFDFADNPDVEHEKLLAVEVDDENGYLYTLSENGLYRETFTGAPWAPYNKTFLQLTPDDPDVLPDLSDPLTPPLLDTDEAKELLKDVKLIPGQNGGYVLVLTDMRVIVIQSTSTGLALLPPGTHNFNHGQCLDLRTIIALSGPSGWLLEDPTSAFNDLKVSRLEEVKVSIDASGKTIAYLLAGAKQYPGHLSPVQPYSEVLLLCDLNAAGNFLQPRLNAYTGTDPDAVQYAYWNPYTAEPAYPFPFTASTLPPELASEVSRQHSAYDLVTRNVGGQTEVLLACGLQKQLRKLSASFAPGGIIDIGTAHPPHGWQSFVVDDGLQNLLLLQQDDTDADLLYVHGTSSFYTVDLSSPSGTDFPSVDQEPFRMGGLADAALVSMPHARRVVWTAGSTQVDHVLKAYDVTDPTPTLLGQYGYLWRSDGGVALDADNTYVLTFGGVRRYVRNNNQWIFGGYQPAEISEGSTKVQFNTEQLDIGHLAEGDDRLFLAVNTGLRSGFIECKIDRDNTNLVPDLDPLPASFIEIDPDDMSWPQGEHQIYTNDVVFVSFQGQQFVLVDVTRIDPSALSSEGSLVAFRWNGASWEFAAKFTTHLPLGLTVTINIASTGTDHLAAFVTGDFGVVSFDLSDLADTIPAITLRSNVNHSQNGSWGMAVAGSRLVVFYDLNSAVEPEIVVYNWETLDDATHFYGTIDAEAPVQSLNPTVFEPRWSSTFHARFDPDASVPGKGDIYNSNEKRVFRLAYDPNAPTPLSYTAYWGSDYADSVQDCRVYNFGGIKRLLVTKDTEAFAWVIP